MNHLNQVYGELTVIEVLDTRNKSGNRLFKCKCACGNIKEIASNNLELMTLEQHISLHHTGKTKGINNNGSYVNHN